MRAIKQIMVVLAAIMFSIQTTAAESLSSKEAAFAFGAGHELTYAKDLLPLSDAEMAATEGEWIPLVVWGARAAYTGYRAYRTYRTANGYVKPTTSLEMRYRITIAGIEERSGLDSDQLTITTTNMAEEEIYIATLVIQ